MNQFQLLNHRQQGFQSSESTYSALLSFFETVVDLIQTAQSLAAVFYDLSRAFDCVNHNKLLGILDRWGIWGVSNSWIHSFVTICYNYNKSWNHQWKCSKVNIKCGLFYLVRKWLWWNYKLRKLRCLLLHSRQTLQWKALKFCIKHFN